MRGAWMAGAVLAGFSVALSACSGSITTETNGSGGQTTSNGGSGGDANGGANADGGTGPLGGEGPGGSGGAGGAAGGAAPGAGGFGYVGLIKDGGEDFGIGIFQDYPGPGCGAVTKTFGACGYVEQSASCGAAYHDAGTVTIQSPIATTTLTVDMNTTVSDSPLFQPGQAVLVKATGGAEVPAFTGDLVAPPSLMLTAPSFEAPFSVDKSAGLPLSWQATTGRVVVWLMGNGGDDPMRTISCNFDGAAGAGTIPPEVLALTPDTSGLLIVYATSQKSVMAGDWPVSLFLEIKATDAGGYPAMAEVTLQ